MSDLAANYSKLCRLIANASKNLRSSSRISSELVNQPTEIPLAARDQIFRMRNGPGIALFLSFAPEVCSALRKMDPAKAAETIEDISHDLDYGNIPPEKIGYSVWKEARNREKAPKVRGKR